MAVYLGLDGGASKTAGVAVDADGRVLARHRAGGAWVPPDQPPTDAACATLRLVADALCRQAGVKLTDVRKGDELDVWLQEGRLEVVVTETQKVRLS